ncbi:MAG: glycerol-3-phosphate dehydrogenase/oxidase [bacterium]|nr:glycerol-3-phosphate dehydrogenase/oxidase [bacterium]
MEVQRVDLLIIGGGINGVEIARQASASGKSVALVERASIGSGASSKSSKLAHGGLRYLEQFKIGLVKESLCERNGLLRDYPDLVWPLAFWYPVFADSPRPLWQVKLGLKLYDFLAAGSPMPKSHGVTMHDFESRLPDFRQDGLKGGACYYDAQMNDLELVKRVASEAAKNGAQIYENSPVSNLIIENGRVVGANIQTYAAKSPNQTSGIYKPTTMAIRATQVINVTGAWSNTILAMDESGQQNRVFPSKGVHITLPRLTNDQALILHAPQDKRVFFIMPYGDQSLVGTTDTPFNGDPSHVTVTKDDLNYLLEAVNFYFPTRQFERQHIGATFAGLRPLAIPAGITSPTPGAMPHASQLSRDMEIYRSPSGMITMLGGKYTTFRAMARALLKAIEKSI